MEKYKSGLVTITVDYGYDIHSISFSGRSYARVNSGKMFTIKGNGFHWDGDPDQDYWVFNKEQPGSLYIYTAGGGEVFTGNIQDHEVVVELYENNTLSKQSIHSTKPFNSQNPIDDSPQITANTNPVIDQIKLSLMQHVEEWLGCHIPEEGTEDHGRWDNMVLDINEIQTIEDVISYLEPEGIDVIDFFINGEFNLVDAGMKPEEIPQRIIFELGDEIVIDGPNVKNNIGIYEYCGKYFLTYKELNKQMQVFDSELCALKASGLNHISNPKAEEDNKAVSMHVEDKAITTPDLKTTMSRTAILLIVTEWPSGTMAMKLGSAIRKSLGVTDEQMTLVQMSPERIFRVETSIEEARFRDELSRSGVSCPGNILFIEM